jgi:hypothetical protein
MGYWKTVALMGSALERRREQSIRVWHGLGSAPGWGEGQLPT